MKKAFKVSIIITAVLVAVFLASYGRTVYTTQYKLTDVSVSVSPDGKYEALLQMVGQPEWPFGDTTARVTITKDEMVIGTVTDDISDDGRCLTEYNWNVVWHDETVEITLKGEEQRDLTYTFNLK